MAINVSHQPGFSSVGNTAYQSGQGASRLQDFNAALSLAQMQQRERMGNLNAALSQWGTRFGAQNSNYQLGQRIRADIGSQLRQQDFNRESQVRQIGAQQQMAMFNRQSQQQMAQFQRFSNIESRAQEEGMRNRLANQDFLQRQEAQKQQFEMNNQRFELQLNATQKRRMEDLNNGMEWIQNHPGFTEQQKQDALNQLQMQYHQIQPLPRPAEESPWPENEQPGVPFTRGGMWWSRELDANGNVRMKNHGPIAPDEPEQRDMKPFPMGGGVYQYSPDGKLNPLVKPPEPIDSKTLSSLYMDLREQFARNSIPSEPGAQPKDFEEDFQKAYRNMVSVLQQQQMMQHQEAFARAMGDTASQLPVQQDIPVGSPSGGGGDGFLDSVLNDEFMFDGSTEESPFGEYSDLAEYPLPDETEMRVREFDGENIKQRLLEDARRIQKSQRGK